jgi:DNA-binding CsgD family transcriptional regulator
VNQLFLNSKETLIFRSNPSIAFVVSERRILKSIAEGLSSKEIGNKLSIHYRTVENPRTNICRKLNIEGANALLRSLFKTKKILSPPVSDPF